MKYTYEQELLVQLTLTEVYALGLLKADNPNFGEITKSLLNKLKDLELL